MMSMPPATAGDPPPMEPVTVAPHASDIST
jgi:hypothetical protein